MPTCGGERCCWCLVLFIASGSLRGGRNRSAVGFLKRIYMAIKRMTMGLIVGNRGFFPDHLAKSGREEMLRALASAGMDVVALTPEQSKYGAVETREETKRCAELFKLNRDCIDGVVVTLPNFGEERAIADTLRYSEKILEANGISIETLDLSEVLGRIERMKDNDDAPQAKLAAIQKYVDSANVPKPALLKMAKLGAVIDQWMAATDVTISAVQCWTSIEENLGVVPCTVMSMMSNELLSSACEVDICGVLGMHALQLASGTPSALLDWNNNYGSDPNKAVCFHCSNLPKHFFRSVKMDFQEIIAGTVGKENTFGTCVGLIKPGPMSFARFSTNDTAGKMRGYVGEGRFTDDPLNTFGGAGVVEIPRMQKLLHFICENGFEHHVAANLSTVASAVHEATTRYLGWEMYWHERSNGAC